MLNKKIKKEALELPNDDRAKLAHLLIESLHPDLDFGSAKAWSRELKKRVTQYEQGQSSTIPWEEVKKNALGNLK